jgi:hypothetical protein
VSARQIITININIPSPVVESTFVPRRVDPERARYFYTVPNPNTPDKIQPNTDYPVEVVAPTEVAGGGAYKLKVTHTLWTTPDTPVVTVLGSFDVETSRVHGTILDHSYHTFTVNVAAPVGVALPTTVTLRFGIQSGTTFDDQKDLDVTMEESN